MRSPTNFNLILICLFKNKCRRLQRWRLDCIYHPQSYVFTMKIFTNTQPYYKQLFYLFIYFLVNGGRHNATPHKLFARNLLLNWMDECVCESGFLFVCLSVFLFASFTTFWSIKTNEYNDHWLITNLKWKIFPIYCI